MSKLKKKFKALSTRSQKTKRYVGFDYNLLETEAFKYLNLKHSGCIKTQMDKGRKAYGYYWSIK